MPSKPKIQLKIKTNLPLECEYTKQFGKDWVNLERSWKCNMDRLKKLMMKLIANDGPLDAVHLEHELQGVWSGYYECHMGGDVLLIYARGERRIVFTRAGSHAALFEN